MATRLLEEVHRCHVSSRGSQWCTWLSCLPRHIATPLEYSPEELAATQDEELIGSVKSLKAQLQASFEVSAAWMGSVHISCSRSCLPAQPYVAADEPDATVSELRLRAERVRSVPTTHTA